MEAELDSPYLLLHQGKISSISDLLPLLEKVVGAGRPLVIVAEDVDGEALSTLVVNKIRGGLAVAAVKAPGFGDRRKAMLEDMAVLTGGQVVAPEVGLKLSEVGLEVLGSARRVVITKDTTTIVDGAGAEDAVADRVAQLRREIELTDSQWDREKLQERLAKISGGVAVDRGRRAHRGRDEGAQAPHRGRRLGDQGRRRGGHRRPAAAALWSRPAPCSPTDSGSPVTSGPASRWSPHRCRRPLRAIADNAGEPGGVIVAHAAEQPAGHGFDAATGEWGDLQGRGDRRPGQGDPLGAGERGVDRRAGAHHRGSGRREAGGAGPCRRQRSRPQPRTRRPPPLRAARAGQARRVLAGDASARRVWTWMLLRGAECAAHLGLLRAHPASHSAPARVSRRA